MQSKKFFWKWIVFNLLGAVIGVIVTLVISYFFYKFGPYKAICPPEDTENNSGIFCLIFILLKGSFILGVSIGFLQQMVISSWFSSTIHKFYWSLFSGLGSLATLLAIIVSQIDQSGVLTIILTVVCSFVFGTLQGRLLKNSFLLWKSWPKTNALSSFLSVIAVKINLGFFIPIIYLMLTAKTLKKISQFRIKTIKS